MHGRLIMSLQSQSDAKNPKPQHRDLNYCQYSCFGVLITATVYPETFLVTEAPIRSRHGSGLFVTRIDPCRKNAKEGLLSFLRPLCQLLRMTSTWYPRISDRVQLKFQQGLRLRFRASGLYRALGFGVSAATPGTCLFCQGDRWTA